MCPVMLCSADPFLCGLLAWQNPSALLFCSLYFFSNPQLLWGLFTYEVPNRLGILPCCIYKNDWKWLSACAAEFTELLKGHGVGTKIIWKEKLHFNAFARKTFVLLEKHGALFKSFAIPGETLLVFCEWMQNWWWKKYKVGGGRTIFWCICERNQCFFGGEWTKQCKSLAN